MMSTIELMPPGGGRGGGGSGENGIGSGENGGGSGAGDSSGSSELRHRRILPKIDDRKADEDWHQLYQETGGDGTAIVSGYTSSTLSLPNGVIRDVGQYDNFYAPEPSSALLILGGTTLLALRRRRRV
jgi:hypothetical protein